jgi:hypothetical protein
MGTPDPRRRIRARLMRRHTPGATEPGTPVSVTIVSRTGPRAQPAELARSPLGRKQKSGSEDPGDCFRPFRKCAARSGLKTPFYRPGKA